MRWNVMRKDWFAVFQVKVTVRTDKKVTVFTVSPELPIFLKPNIV